ncbi:MULTISPECIES: hypothetical protein [Vibrio]|nr:MULTISPECIES: hypothetical protein [Vibrio]
MSDQYVNEESLELLDAMEIGINLADYQQANSNHSEESFND